MPANTSKGDDPRGVIVENPRALKASAALALTGVDFSVGAEDDLFGELGYFEGDSVYSMSFSFLHTGPLTVNFSGDFPAVDPEEWGIDNVTVQATVIPEPSSLIVWSFIGLSVATIGLWRRRGKLARFTVSER